MSMKLQIALSYQEVRGDYSVVETTRQERLLLYYLKRLLALSIESELVPPNKDPLPLRCACLIGSRVSGVNIWWSFVRLR